MAQQLFGLVPAGLPVFTTPTETPSPTSFIYTIPTAKPFSHIVIFLLPGVVLPDNTAAAIYLVTPGQQQPASGGGPSFQFLGGVGPGKESAIFKLNAAAESSGHVVLGISVEEAGSVAQRIEELAQAKAGTGSMALVPASASSAQQGQGPSTLVLAQRIIKNAFNFLSGFSGQAGQVEVVPLKAFEEWWRKFESKVRTDPRFLERDDS